jgi:hypothetical protein
MKFTHSTSTFIIIFVVAFDDRTWGAYPLSIDKAKASKLSVRILWDDRQKVWGRVCNESLLTYAHLLIGIWKYVLFFKYLTNIQYIIGTVKENWAIKVLAMFKMLK